MNYFDFKRIRKEINKIISKKYNINYFNINNIRLKIKHIDEIKNIIFLVNAEFEEIEKLNKIINIIKTKYFIENKKINIIFCYKKSKTLIDYLLLKNVFNKYNVIKLKINKNKYIIDEKTINRINIRKG